jgi:predicted alpha/beta-hydrolase family hydrolase
MNSTSPKQISITVSNSIGNISGLILEPKPCKAMIVLAHGAGAGMTHKFMESLAAELASLSMGTLRYNFPYMENGKKRPDPPAIAEKTVEAALNKTQELFSSIPVYSGGKSFGGRMTSHRLSKECPAFVKGIIFFGFPLHAAGNPSTDRAAHLANIHIPMLFLQGTRDALAELSLIEKVCSGLPTATLTKFEGADHSFKSGKKDFVSELASATDQWVNSL